MPEILAPPLSQIEPGGYALLACPAGTLVINQFVQKNMPFDPEKLEPVVLLSKVPIALSVRRDLPVNSVQELIAYAKRNPGKLNYATQGPGSTAHLTTVMFQTATGVELVHVPYKGSAPALADLMAGTVDMMFDTYTSSATYHKAGKLKLLAVASARRLASLPEVPTVREAGLEDFESSTWNGMLAPPGTPDSITEQLNREINEILAAPELQAKLRSLRMTRLRHSRGNGPAS
jgi:tripartite-type tricarboxylate transporter receptor subunit TctC